MSKLCLLSPAKPTLPEAGHWESGLLVRVGEEDVGLGLALFSSDRVPLAAIQLTPQEAVELAQYLFRNALRMYKRNDEGQLAARLEVQKVLLHGRTALAALDKQRDAAPVR